MKLPALPYGVVAMGGLIEWLRVFVASVVAGWRVEHTAEGRHEWHWATPTFNANRFTGAGSLVWTVGSSDVLLERYAVLGNTLVWMLRVGTSSTSGAGDPGLCVSVPGTLQLANCLGSVVYAVDAGAAVAGGPVQKVNSRQVALYRYDGGNWSAAASNNTWVYMTVIGELV